jgi:hypothetical protein
LEQETVVAHNMDSGRTSVEELQEPTAELSAVDFHSPVPDNEGTISISQENQPDNNKIHLTAEEPAAKSFVTSASDSSGFLTAEDFSGREQVVLSSLQTIIPTELIYSMQDKSTEISFVSHPLVAITGDIPFPSEAPYFTGKPLKNKPVKSWIIGADVAPMYSFRVLSNHAADAGRGDHAIDLYNENEEGIIAFAAGMNINYMVSENISFESGIYYSGSGQVNNNPLEYNFDGGIFYLNGVSASAGDFSSVIEQLPKQVVKIPQQDKDSLANPLVGNARIVQKFEYLEIPFLMKYRIGMGKLGVNVSGGIVPSLLVGNSNHLEVDGSSRIALDSPEMHSVLYNGAVSFGLDYRLGKRTRFNVQPTVRYSFTPMIKGAEIRNNAYSLGWFSGIKYAF